MNTATTITTGNEKVDERNRLYAAKQNDLINFEIIKESVMTIYPAEKIGNLHDVKEWLLAKGITTRAELESEAGTSFKLIKKGGIYYDAIDC